MCGALCAVIIHHRGGLTSVPTGKCLVLAVRALLPLLSRLSDCVQHASARCLWLPRAPSESGFACKLPAADAGGLNDGTSTRGARSGVPLPCKDAVSTAAALRPAAADGVARAQTKAASAAAASGGTGAHARADGDGGSTHALAAVAPRGPDKPAEAAEAAGGSGGGNADEATAAAVAGGALLADARHESNAAPAAAAAQRDSCGSKLAEGAAGGAATPADAPAGATGAPETGPAKVDVPRDKGGPEVNNAAADASVAREAGPAGEERSRGAAGEGSAKRARTSGKGEGWRPPDDATWMIEEPEAGTETALRCPTRDLWRQFQEALDKGLKPLALREELRGILKAGRQILADQPRVGRMCRGKEEPTVARAKSLLSQLTERMKACHKRRMTETVDTEEVPGPGGSQGGSQGVSGRTPKRSASDVRGSTGDLGGSEEGGAAGDDEAGFVGTRSRASKRLAATSVSPAERPRRSGGSTATERGKRARK